eukprot:6183841-Pleurochrysis_carterae.AAC.1
MLTAGCGGKPAFTAVVGTGNQGKQVSSKYTSEVNTICSPGTKMFYAPGEWLLRPARLTPTQERKSVLVFDTADRGFTNPF